MTRASHANPERPILTREEMQHLSTFLTSAGRIDVKGLLAAYHDIVDERRARAWAKRYGFGAKAEGETT